LVLRIRLARALALSWGSARIVYVIRAVSNIDIVLVSFPSGFNGLRLPDVSMCVVLSPCEVYLVATSTPHSLLLAAVEAFGNLDARCRKVHRWSTQTVYGGPKCILVTLHTSAIRTIVVRAPAVCKSLLITAFSVQLVWLTERSATRLQSARHRLYEQVATSACMYCSYLCVSCSELYVVSC
jgi:hypothetical protein